jgi:hypothetical protein
MAKKKNIENNLLDNLDYEKEEQLFYGINILDEREFSKFIKKTESLCRNSQEYTMWSQRTKMYSVNQNPDPEKDDSSQCPICSISYEYANAESHHHPATLFNLCVKMFQEWIDSNQLEDKAPLDLVQEVMADHLIGSIEHVVLCKHCHEKYHNGEQFIKELVNKIIDYKREVRKENMSDNVKEKYDQINLTRKTEWDEKIERRRNLILNDDISNLDREKLTKEILDSIDEEITI